MGKTIYTNKSELAASMGIVLPTGEGVTCKSQSKNPLGAEIVRRAGYGKLTADNLCKFLAAYIDCGHKAKSALIAGLSYESIRRHEKNDPDFAEEVDQAHELFTARLSDAAYKAAVQGWKRPLFDSKGNHVGDEWKFSERILELLLKRHDPNFRDKVEVDQKISGGVVVIQAPLLTKDDWKKQVAAARGQSELIDGEARSILSGNP